MRKSIQQPAAPHTINFDVMVQENGERRFVCSMSMPYNRLFPPSQEEWVDFIVSQRPSLKNKDIKIAL